MAHQYQHQKLQPYTIFDCLSSNDTEASVIVLWFELLGSFDFCLGLLEERINFGRIYQPLNSGECAMTLA